MSLLTFAVILSIFSAGAAEPALPPIEQAQALALKKNRQEASAVLLKAIEGTVAGSKNRNRLAEALHTVSKVFFSDKGQRLYEAGQSVMYETPDVALGQFRDALALEDNNVLILNNVTRVHLNKQDCSGALASIQTARAVDPYWPESAVLELRALTCLKNFEVFREKLKAAPAFEKTQEPFVQFLLAQDLLQQNMWKRASDILVKVSEDQPRFPETYYWLSKANIELNRDGDVFAQKYVSLCKALGPRERKNFSFEPRVCLNAKEVEDELAKKNTDL